jgi:cytochrome c2
MRPIRVKCGFALLALLLLNAGCEREAAAPAAEYQPRWHFLAAGDPAAGARVFADLKCHTCHTVSGRAVGSTKNSGPELGSMVSGLSPDEIAAAIIAPSHSVSSKGGLWREEKPSKMGDYSQVMTVRQLMDVVAYLRAPRDDLNGE